MTTIRFVCATRATVSTFSTQTALGRSLALYQYPIVTVRLFAENRSGLSEVYNLAIRESANDPAILVFAHDDIFLSDFFWPSRLLQALNSFQIVGVAGNRRRVPRQPGWPFIDELLTNDQPSNLSGIVGHGGGFPPENLSVYGTPGVEVKLLDGVLLAAQSALILEKNLWFDERFQFHFYDMDFCRQAESRGLTMGTAELSLIHQSQGNYRSGAWEEAYRAYITKWGD